MLIMRQNISCICGRRVPLPVVDLFHIAFFWGGGGLIYVPSKHVACGCAVLCSSDLFCQEEGKRCDVSPQASSGVFQSLRS